MPLTKDIKNDIKAAKKIQLPWWALLCLGIGAFLVAWLFDHVGRFNLVLPTLNCIFVLGFAIAVKRKLNRHGWFWGTMAILAALHVPLVLFVPWTTKWVPGLEIAAIDSADLILILAILAIVEKFMERPKTAAPDSYH
jgi:ABC-type multidrug transport system permease subunit